MKQALLKRFLTPAFAIVILTASCWGQGTTVVSGSPNATTSIDGKQLPPPDPKFQGVIKGNALQSKAWWAPRVVPPQGAPNVLLIMTDDVGFAAPSTFGGVIPTPALDRIGKKRLALYSISLDRSLFAQPRGTHHRS